MRRARVTKSLSRHTRTTLSVRDQPLHQPIARTALARADRRITATRTSVALRHCTDARRQRRSIARARARSQRMARCCHSAQTCASRRQCCTARRLSVDGARRAAACRRNASETTQPQRRRADRLAVLLSIVIAASKWRAASERSTPRCTSAAVHSRHAPSAVPSTRWRRCLAASITTAQCRSAAASAHRRLNNTTTTCARAAFVAAAQRRQPIRSSAKVLSPSSEDSSTKESSPPRALPPRVSAASATVSWRLTTSGVDLRRIATSGVSVAKGRSCCLAASCASASVALPLPSSPFAASCASATGAGDCIASLWRRTVARAASFSCSNSARNRSRCSTSALALALAFASSRPSSSRAASACAAV